MNRSSLLLVILSLIGVSTNIYIIIMNPKPSAAMTVGLICGAISVGYWLVTHHGVRQGIADALRSAADFIAPAA